jgi:hypothetical protein
MVNPVLVIWHDAHAGSGTWEHLRDLEDDGNYVVRSIGYLIDGKKHGKKKHISIAQSLSEADCVDSVLHIPVAMVQQVINLVEETIKEEQCISIPVRQISPSTSWSGSRPEV